jgi:hypothetical protein
MPAVPAAKVSCDTGNICTGRLIGGSAGTRAWTAYVSYSTPYLKRTPNFLGRRRRAQGYQKQNPKHAVRRLMLRHVSQVSHATSAHTIRCHIEVCSVRRGSRIFSFDCDIDPVEGIIDKASKVPHSDRIFRLRVIIYVDGLARQLDRHFAAGGFHSWDGNNGGP